MRSTIIGIALFAPFFASACIEDVWRGGYGMMGGYGGGFGFFMVAGGIIWTVVGVLAGVWLWQQVNKKGGGH